jgi:hypothetical protein
MLLLARWGGYMQLRPCARLGAATLLGPGAGAGLWVEPGR